MFRTLRTRLTVLYGGLFAAILVVIALAVYGAVSSAAMRNARQELTTSATVFDRVWALRTAQLENGAGLLSRDFGFREAIASHDADTIRSALDNLQQRLGMDLALTIGLDGQVVAGPQTPVGLLTPAILASLKSDENVSGVIVLGGAPYEVVSVPVAAPVTMGWVVFAAKLDRAQMRALEALAAAPLQASIVKVGARERPQGREGDLIARTLAGGVISPRALTGPDGRAMVLARPLASLDPGERVVLLLKYPMARAMAPYNLLLGLLVLIAVIGLAAVLAGTIALARSVTRPLSALEEAARRMQAGELAHVEVETRDEIGALALGFNRMVEEIGQRDRDKDRAAEALERARDQAEAANRAKSAFLANMSHEVRTSLNGVMGVAGVLAQSHLTRAQRDMVAIIQGSADVLQRVLGDVLELARVEGGGLEIVEADFDLAEAVSLQAHAAEDRCREKGLAFTFDLDPAAGAKVSGDRARLEQVLSNLLGNAVKFTAQGQVALAVRKAPGGFVFAVTDTGVGFEPAAAESLFRPFHQADGSITRRFGGSGLGLSISRELALAMGGDLVAEGAPGRGATFTLTLPLRVVGTERRARDDADNASADEAAMGRPVRILLADDHETNRTVARLILASAGVELTEVEDGAQAVEAFEHAPFDVVLMDLQMPVMDGLTAIRLMRGGEQARRAHRTPILVVSANALPEHVEAAAEAGADGHLAKPITPPQLIGAVERALRRGGNRERREVA